MTESPPVQLCGTEKRTVHLKMNRPCACYRSAVGASFILCPPLYAVFFGTSAFWLSITAGVSVLRRFTISSSRFTRLDRAVQERLQKTSREPARKNSAREKDETGAR